MAIRFGYVKGEVIREELARLKDRIRDPDSEFISSLVGLLGLELWLQVFFGDKLDLRRSSGMSRGKLSTIMAGEAR